MVKNIDYSKTIIYKITCKDDNIGHIYIGSTSKSLQERYIKHKYDYGKKISRKIYETIRNNGGWDNWQIIEIEKYPCESKKQAFERESYHYKQLNADMNSRDPSRHWKQYKIDNRELLCIKAKTYYQENLDKVKEYKRKIAHITSEKHICECGGKYTTINKNCHLNTKKHLSFVKK